MTEFTWTYLQILEIVRAPLTAMAAGIFAVMLQMQLVQRQPPMRWLVMLNHAILLQFAAMLLAWLLIALQSDRDYYYFIVDFFLITWTSLPFFVLASLLPLAMRLRQRRLSSR
ncbi:MAG TPA: hypothetical protein VGD52_17540 [Pseudoduganella sp.]